jgi:enoyl-CoA hydratase/carnithine racemase
MSTNYEIRDDGVAVITVKNPPVNALSNHVLKSLITTCEIIDVRLLYSSLLTS